MGIADMPAGARRSLPLGAEPARSSVLGSYRSATFVFAPARFLDYARNDGVRERSAWLAGGRGTPLPVLPKVSMGIADMPAGARRSLPLGAEPARSSVLGSYRSATFVFAPARFLDYARNDGVRERSAWLAGGRGTPLPILPKVSTGIADMPAGAPCHRRLARRGSLPAPTCSMRLFYLYILL